MNLELIAASKSPCDLEPSPAMLLVQFCSREQPSSTMVAEYSEAIHETQFCPKVQSGLVIWQILRV